jgi:poly-gamma-glutamate synthesis protein (capsule biosynthesis protein)
MVLTTAALASLLFASCGILDPPLLPESAWHDILDGAIHDHRVEMPGPARLPPPFLEKEITVLAFGDILLARSPGKRVEEFGFKYLFSGIQDLISNADIAFANLETPAAYLGAPFPLKPPIVTFRADPATLFGLAWAGFDIVSVANNHISDYGPRALSETMEFLDLLGIARVGAGRSLEEARQAAIIERRGIRVAFLAYADPIWSAVPANSITSTMTWERVESRLHGPIPGLASALETDSPTASPAGISPKNLDFLRADIGRVRSILRPDYIMVSVHWGIEHQHYPDAAQRQFGRAAIDAGATVVLGHHPHVLQSVEKYKDGLIIYSLGNLVFDMAADSTYRTAAFRLVLSGGSIARAEIQPILIARTSYIPRLATGTTARSILTDLQRWSERYGTIITISNDLGFID